MTLLTRIKGQEKAVALALGGAGALILAGVITWFNLASQPPEETAKTDAASESATSESADKSRPETALRAPGGADPAGPSGDARTAPDQPAPDQPDQAGAQPASPGPKTAAPAPEAPATPQPPKFDLVRVDPQGAAVVAGKADPGGRVSVYLDGAVIAEATADASGSFVAMFDMPANGAAQVITLQSRDRDGAETGSGEQVVVVAREAEGDTGAEPAQTTAAASGTAPGTTPETAPGASPMTSSKAAPAATQMPPGSGAETATGAEPSPEAPAIIIAGADGARVLQPGGPAGPAPSVMSEVTLDLIAYDDSGEVVLSGRGAAERHVRVYVDDRPVKTGAVAEDGSWRLSLPEVDAGRYRLRVDQIDDGGKVISRLETPFQKEKPEDVKQAASGGGAAPAAGKTIEKVTIQRGATLWALAKGKYGEGRLYMQIFNANRSQIRDPDLIYPGQIFTLPD